MKTLAAVFAVVFAAACGPPEDEGWTPAFDAEPVGWLLNVWGPAADDLYAVGGEPDTGVIMHFDGSDWAPVDIGLDVPLLNWIFGFGPNDITAVGREGTVIHWDGTSWTAQATTTVEDLWGVWGASPDDLWAVGGRGREEGQATLLHYDGTSWTEQTIPTLERPNVFALFKVFGTSANNVVVVGQRGAVLRYDGATWTEELVGASDDLISVWATGPDNIVAVGGRGAGIISRYDGSAWTTESLAPLPGLNGIWLDDDKTAHVVGTVGALAEVNLETFEAERSFVATDRDFHAVFSADGGELTAVGGNLFAVEAPYNGVAFRRSVPD